jgi:hypothetical protein
MNNNPLGIILLLFGVIIFCLLSVYASGLGGQGRYAFLFLFAGAMIFVGGMLLLVPQIQKELERRRQIQSENDRIRLLEEKRLQEEQQLLKKLEQLAKEQLEIERQKNVWSEFSAWRTEPWKDRTKKISKLAIVRVNGYYDSITQEWNDRPMELMFYFEKERYSVNISRAQAIVAKENLSALAPLFFYKDVVSKEITKKMMLFFYQNNWYYTFDDINIQDAIVLVEATYKYDKEKLQREVEQAKGILSAETVVREDSRIISDSVKTFVWNRDGGRCVQCGSQKNIEFDHIIPFSKGGSNTARNIQILCQDCNRKKGTNIV